MATQQEREFLAQIDRELDDVDSRISGYIAAAIDFGAPKGLLDALEGVRRELGTIAGYRRLGMTEHSARHARDAAERFYKATNGNAPQRLCFLLGRVSRFARVD